MVMDGSEQADGERQRRYRERAVAAYAALQQEFGADRDLFRDNEDRPYAYHWPFSQAMAATIAMAGLPEVGQGYRPAIQRCLAGAERYWNRRRKPPGYDSYLRGWLSAGGDLYYDDNAWTGLNLIWVYRLTGDVAAFERARQVFELLVSGWDDDPNHPAPGGVFWTQADWSRDRNTVSTAPAAELGVHLAELSQDDRLRDYRLAWARRMYDWLYQYLRAPDGLFWDSINLTGQIEQTQWSYNQGTVIGLNTLFSRVTGDAGYRQRAEELAGAALERFAEPDALAGQPVAFNAIFFRNLLLLQAENGNSAYRAAMQRYADWLWDAARDPATNLCRLSQPVKLLDQAALTQILALLAWEPDRYSTLT